MARPKVHDEKLRARLLERAGALVSDGGPEALSLRTLARDCETSTTAVYALWWSSKNGQLRDFERGATSIFDAQEPVGEMTDHFPPKRRKAPRPPVETRPL